jgi:hypothetical protein
MHRVIFILCLLSTFALCENDFEDEQQAKKTQVEQKKEKRKYFIPDNNRIDAGVFHVGFALGGNFYIEPRLNNLTKAPTGDYFRNFGFQGGAFFDWDYGDIPLGLRVFVGYKYILASVHAFSVDAIARHMFSFSDKVRFGVGVGTSASIWYRTLTSQTSYEEVFFLPALVASAGFEFNPFMVEFKWLINQFGVDRTITGMEMYFGVRL